MSVRRSELPRSGGIACEAGEVPAWPWTLQEFADDIARGANEYTHRDFDVAANPVLYGTWDVWTYPVKHGR